jgi:hypothetical protein
VHDLQTSTTDASIAKREAEGGGEVQELKVQKFKVERKNKDLTQRALRTQSSQRRARSKVQEFSRKKRKR